MTGSNGTIQGRVRNALGVWQSLTASLGPGINPVAAIDLLGNATAIWDDGGGIGWAGGAALGDGSQQALSGIPTAAPPALATDAAGSTVALFENSAEDQIDIARRTGGHTFGLPTQLSISGHGATDPS